MTLSIACVSRRAAGVLAVTAAVALIPSRTVAQTADPVLLLLGPSAIAPDQPPNGFTASDINASLAAVGQRDVLTYFAGHTTDHLMIPGGYVGNEGWFALGSTPATWMTAANLNDGAANFIAAGPGLGSADANGDASSLLSSVPAVTPLGADGLSMLVGRQVCGVVYDHGIVVNGETLAADLSGTTLGLVAFNVLGVAGQNDDSLPEVEIEIADANQVCHGPLSLLSTAP